jgi:hypothetical protein
MRLVTWHVILPLLSGTAVYLLWRSPTLLVFSWVRASGVDGIVMTIRAIVRPMVELLPGWFLYSLPDGLWVYSFTAFLLATWRGTPPSVATFAWLLAPTTLAVGGEVLQAFRVVPGTFDIADIMMCTLGGALAISWSFRPGTATACEPQEIPSC